MRRDSAIGFFRVRPQASYVVVYCLDCDDGFALFVFLPQCAVVIAATRLVAEVIAEVIQSTRKCTLIDEFVKGCDEPRVYLCHVTFVPIAC